MQIPIDRPLIDGRNLRVAATQTVSAGFVATHNQKSVLLLTCDAADRTSGAPHIQAGVRAGQELTILVTDDANGITITDGNGTGTQLFGSWNIADSYGVGAWLKIVWDGTRWWEIGRGAGGDTVMSGRLAAAFNYSTSASGSFAFAMGYDTSATGLAALALGYSGQANAMASMAMGRDSSANLHGELAHAGGRFGADGDAQFIRVVGCKLVTMSTGWHNILFLDGTDDLLIIPANTMFVFEALVGGVESGLAANKCAYKINDGAIWRDGANNTVLLAHTVSVIHEDSAPYACQCVADNANEALQIQVQEVPDNSLSLRWVAVVWGTMVSFP